MRQIVLAMHNHADSHDGNMPKLFGNSTKYGAAPMFLALMPFLEQGNVFEAYAAGPNYVVKCYVNPADPTVLERMMGEPCSYAANAWAFSYRADFSHRGNLSFKANLASSFPDGTSQTIGLAEHYTRCGSTSFMYGAGWEVFPGMSHRPTFADSSDVSPETQNGQTTSSDGVWTFQVAPAVKDCHWQVPQTPFPGGMSVALIDGSVRVLNGNISVGTFWSAVTPAGSEVLGNDW